MASNPMEMGVWDKKKILYKIGETMKSIFITLMLFATSCSQNNENIKPKFSEYMKCQIEIYCTKTENSILKAAAIRAVEVYFGTEIGNGICEKYYQPWGIDYRLPVEERCK